MASGKVPAGPSVANSSQIVEHAVDVGIGIGHDAAVAAAVLVVLAAVAFGVKR